ncbi:MAG: 3-deoxy-manno-octulosonate cytidylyltransferase [Gammaproteobacteria bacterium]
MAFTVVIPARFASTRLPGKPLLDIAGKPMLQHVYERALQSRAKAVYIATDDERVYSAAQAFTPHVCMTSTSHQSGTDRIQEVAGQLALAQDEIIVNVQGDEPLIPPEAINQVAQSLIDHPQAGIASLYENIENDTEFHNPNIVKVVTDLAGYAHYFSRAPIPCHREGTGAGEVLGKRHIGIYAYRVATLNDYVTWPQVPLELAERLEQLRAMGHGVRIHMQESCVKMPGGVDTPEDLEAVRAYLRSAV